VVTEQENHSMLHIHLSSECCLISCVVLVTYRDADMSCVIWIFEVQSLSCSVIWRINSSLEKLLSYQMWRNFLDLWTCHIWYYFSYRCYSYWW